MRAPWFLAITLAIAALVSANPGIADVGGGRSPLERLSQAVKLHPSDPDLSWAYARNLASTGKIAEALRQTREFLTQWPTRRPDARVEIARTFIEIEANDAALDLLDEELAVNPRSANARFYRAIVFRSDGRLLEADREFEIAGRLEPTLRPETLLARALGLFEMGHEDQAVDLLIEILTLDPTGDSAMRARLLLRQREILDFEGQWRLDAYAGFDWDDNVTLESSAEEVLPSNRADFRGVWGAGGSWRSSISESVGVTIGYRFDQTKHVDLSEYDLLSNTIFVSGTWRATERIAIRVDAIAYDTLQDLDQELVGGLVRPNLIFSFGRDWGATRAFTQFEIVEYDDDAPFDPWERDAYAYGLGLEHFLPLRADDSWLAFSASWARTITQAEAGGGSDGFDGDFDYDSWRARGLGMFALPFDFRSQIDVSYTHDRYHNDNLSHAIATIGGTRQREDDIMSGRVSISRPIVERVRLEVYWEGTRRISNVDLFDYDKQQAGMLLRIATN